MLTKTVRYAAHTLHQERPFWGIWLPVIYGSGIGIYFGFDWEPPVWVAPAFFMLSLSLYPLAMTEVRKVLCLSVGALAAGTATADMRTAYLQDTTPYLVAGPKTVVGTVDHVNRRPSDTRVIIRTSLDDGAHAGYRLRITVRGQTSGLRGLSAGETIRVRAVIRPPPSPVMPGAFDFQRHAFFQDIDGFGFAVGPVIRSSRLKKSGFRGYWPIIDGIRDAVTTRVLSAHPDQSGAVAAALLTGHREHLNEATLQTMRDAGIAHLLAISGLHIGLVAGFAFAATRLLITLYPPVALSYDGKKIAAAAAMAAALSYALLAGFTVPTQRAFMMTALVLVGMMLDRRPISLKSVAIAAGAILIFRPESLLQPGFQMSFAAVTALVSAHMAYTRWARRRGMRRPASNIIVTALRYLGGVMAVSLVAGAATAPFAIYHFQHMAAFGIVANILAVPIAAFCVMPAGMLALVTMPFGGESLPLAVMSAGIDLILFVASWAAGLPAAAMDLPAMPVGPLSVLVFGALWLTLWQKSWRLCGVPIMLVGVIWTHYEPVPDVIIDGAARIVMLRDGAGQYFVSSRRRATFAAKIWRRRGGSSDPPGLLPKDAKAPSEGLFCDRSGCILDKNQRRIAIAFDQGALIDDCARSDLVISFVPIRKACQTKRIDRFDLWRYGTHAIFVNETGIEIRSVNGQRGHRPWTRVPAAPQVKTVNIGDRALSEHPGP